MIAAIVGTKDTVELLLKYGADITSETDTGRTALVWAQERHHKGIELVLIRAQKLYQYKKPVFDAVKQGNIPALKALSKRVTMHMYDTNGDTPLHIAVRENRLALVGYMVSINPELLNSKNNAGVTPMELALTSGSPEIKSIIKHLAKKNSKYSNLIVKVKTYFYKN